MYGTTGAPTGAVSEETKLKLKCAAETKRDNEN